MKKSRQPSIFRSLRTRFILIVGLITALCLATATLITLKLNYEQLIGAKREKAAVLQETIAQLFLRAAPMGHKEIQSLFQTVGSHSDIRSVRLVGEDARILKSSHPDEIGLKFMLEDEPFPAPLENPIYSVVDEGTFQLLQQSESGQETRRTVAIVQRPRQGRWAFLPQVFSGLTHRYPRTLSATSSIYDAARCGQCHQKPVPASLNLGLSLEETNWSLQTIGTKLLFWTLLTTVLVGVVISMLFSKLVNRPLSELISTIRSVEKGDLQARTTLRRRDEIGILGEKFNTMVERLGMAQEEIQRYHEEQIEQASRMASVGEMARALAHEVRNPLAGISGAAQVLREDIEPDEPRHRVLTEILEQVDRLARVVSNILRYARFQPLKLEPVALDDVLTEAIAAFEGHLQDQNITVHRTSEADLPQVRVDPGQIQQVFMNLILHASKSMPEGGAIKVGVAPGKDGEKEVQLVRFQDTGTEVPEERLEEFFKPFYTKTSGDTGLGLSVAQRIVSLHGGKISALSEAGHGTVYTIALPVDGPTKTNRHTGTSLAKSTGVQ